MKKIIGSFLIVFLTFLIQQSYAQKFNQKLANELSEIYKDDQKYRHAAILAARKFGSGSAQDNTLMSKQLANDINNLAKIEKIFSEYGYPGKSLVGNFLSKVAFFVVQHNDVSVQEKYLSTFKLAAQQNELEPSLLPLMIDRIRTAKGEQQLYGTQLSEEAGNIFKLYPIEDEANVNIRRKEAGLPPLEAYLAKWKIKYQLPTLNHNPNPLEMYVPRKTKSNSVLPNESSGEDDKILKSLNYPKEAKANNITGFVTIQFVIDQKGFATDIVIIRGLGYGCDEEALRVIKNTKFLNDTNNVILRRMRLPFPYIKAED